MEAFFPDSVKAILVGLIAIAVALGWLARTFPHVTWLQLFRIPDSQMTEAQREKQRRASNRHTAVEIVLVGLALPVGYVLLTVISFRELETMPMAAVGVGSVLCITFGIWSFVRNR